MILKKFLAYILIISILSNFLFVGKTLALETNGTSTPWTIEKAEHLAKRALIGATPDNINLLYQAGNATNAVNLLFPSISGPDRTNYNLELENFKNQTGFSMSDSSQMNKYYQYKIYRDPYEAKIKLFGLFEDIFSVDRTGNEVDKITYLDVENHFEILYSETLGNYKNMVKRVLFDRVKPESSFAMGKYLDLLNQPDKNAPNENYARELLQLFLMLEYKPWEDAESTGAVRNYTEKDVPALARILTGFRSGNDKKVYFDNAYHNTSTGITFLSGSLSSGDNFDFYNTSSGTIDNTKIIDSINGNNGLPDNITDYIFSKRKNEIAYFLGWRLYKFYINDHPSREEIETIGNKILEKDFDIYESVKWLLSSDLMYSEKAMNSLRYKNPIELTIGSLKLINYKNPEYINPIINNSSLLSNFDFSPYTPRSIFGRPGFDENSAFMNGYFHNQWFSNNATRMVFEKSTDFNFKINDFIPKTRVLVIDNLNIESGSGFTYSGTVNLSNINIKLSSDLIIGTKQVIQTQTGELIDTGSLAQTGSVEITENITTNELNFSGGSLDLSKMIITTSSGNTVSFSGSLDMSIKKLTINSGTISYSGNILNIISGSSDVSSDSVLERDINIDEMFDQIEDNLLFGKSIPNNVKNDLKSYLLTDEKGLSRKFLPNNNSYKDKYIRYIFAVLLSQVEFMLQSGFDQPTQNIESSGSPINNKNSKLVLMEMFGGYDWMHAIIPKTDYEYYKTVRGELALSGSDLIDIGDYYINKSYEPIIKYLDSGNLKIFNRVGSPNHSRAHDSAAIQMTSQKAVQTVGTPGLIGELIKNETNPLNNIVLGTNKPTIYTKGNYTNIGASSLKYKISNYSSNTDEINYNINILKNTLNNRDYPLNSQYTFKNSVILDGATSSGTFSVGNTLSGKLNFTKSLINNGVGITYYVGAGGGYDTHEGQQKNGVYNLNTRTNDLAKDISNFFDKNIADGKDVTIVLYSEFGRTIKTNGSAGTDHGKGGGYFVLTTNNNLKNDLNQKVYGKLNPKNDVSDWFGVGIDYRSIFGKILNNLYSINISNYFGDINTLEQELNTKTPNPKLFREEYSNVQNNNNNVNVSLKFGFDDKNMDLKEGSYVRFYRGTDINNLTEESRYNMENYFIKPDGTLSLNINGYKGTKYYYKIDITDNQYDNYSFTGDFIVPDKFVNTLSNNISMTKDSYFSEYNNSIITSEKSIKKITLSNISTGTTVKSFTGGIDIDFGTGEVYIHKITSTGGEKIWNGGFVLPKIINKNIFLSENSNVNGINISNYKVDNVLKIGSDAIGVGMNINKDISISMPISDIQKTYSVLTSQDGINWLKIQDNVIKSNGKVTFKTNHFSYFMTVELTDLSCNLNISPQKVKVGQSYNLNWNSIGGKNFIIDNGIGSVGNTGNKSVIADIAGNKTYSLKVSDDVSDTICVGNVMVYDEKKDLKLNEINSNNTLTGSIKIGSGFSLLGENIPFKIYTFSGADVKDLIGNNLLKNDGSILAKVNIDDNTKLFTSSGNIVFEQKNIPETSLVNGNIKYNFSGAISLGTNDTIILDRPAEIVYYNNYNALKFAYKKTGTNNWIIKNINQNTCNIDLSLNPICAYRVGNDVFIKTYHFTDFSLVDEVNILINDNPKVVSSSGGGSSGLKMDYCPNGDNSPSYYDKTCGISNNKEISKPTEQPKQDINTSKSVNNKVNLSLEKDKKTLALIKSKYKSYDIYLIGNTNYSKRTIDLAKNIVDNKKFSESKKTFAIKQLNEFVSARYELKLDPNNKNKLSKYKIKTILLINSISKNN